MWFVYHLNVWNRTAPFWADLCRSEDLNRKSRRRFQRKVRHLKKIDRIIRQWFTTVATVANSSSIYVETYQRKLPCCCGSDRKGLVLCRNIPARLALRSPVESTETKKYPNEWIKRVQFWLNHEWICIVECNAAQQLSTYIATVSTTKRIVSVGSTDEHLFVVDPRQNSNIILTIILCFFEIIKGSTF